MKQLIYFGAEWCGPCRVIKPQIQSLQNEMTIVFIDVDVSPHAAQRYNVRNVPCVVLVEDTMEKGKLVGNRITPQAVRDLYNK